ncbi:MAG TPA: sigma-70 family RNA polymerase sigma factor [Thermoanaerobaculia bacterium]
MEDEQDAADVARVLAGEAQRFEPIVARWQKPVLNLCWRFVRDEGRAEELAQEAFLKCFRSLGQWRRDARFSTWLFSIAISVCRSHLRRFEPLRDALGAAMLEELATEPHDERVAAGQRAERIRKAVADLPPLYREPLVVYYFHDEDLASTARILDVGEGTLKARLHRAREALRKVLKDLQ